MKLKSLKDLDFDDEIQIRGDLKKEAVAWVRR